MGYSLMYGVKIDVLHPEKLVMKTRFNYVYDNSTVGFNPCSYFIRNYGCQINPTYKIQGELK